jgi:hypothetical protein
MLEPPLQQDHMVLSNYIQKLPFTYAKQPNSLDFLPQATNTSDSYIKIPNPNECDQASRPQQQSRTDNPPRSMIGASVTQVPHHMWIRENRNE